MVPSQKPIHEAIVREETRLARLGAELAEARVRLKSLQEELRQQPAASRDSSALVPSAPVPSTSAEKVALFRSLFCGREDLYPKLWTNARTGRKGYAPACANEWVPGVCEKPRVKRGVSESGISAGRGPGD